MRITAEMAIAGAARTLREQVAPALEDRFAAEAARLAGLLLTLAADSLDDAAEIRVSEIAGLRAILADAATLPALDPALARCCAEAAARPDPGLRLSSLEDEIRALRTVLIALHAAVETATDPASRALDAAIWRLLREVDAARAPRDGAPGR